MYTNINLKREAFLASTTGRIVLFLETFSTIFITFLLLGYIMSLFLGEFQVFSKSTLLLFSVIGLFISFMSTLGVMVRGPLDTLVPLTGVWDLFPTSKKGLEKVINAFPEGKSKMTIYREANFILNKDRKLERIDHYTITYSNDGITSKQTLEEVVNFISAMETKKFLLKTTEKASEYSLGSNHEVVTFPLNNEEFSIIRGLIENSETLKS